MFINHSTGRNAMQKYAKSDPRYHTEKIRTELNSLITHLREDIRQVEDPKAEALFETTAEVLTGLGTAFKHYEEKSEKAWQ
jgi:hypothetical protein